MWAVRRHYVVQSVEVTTTRFRAIRELVALPIAALIFLALLWVSISLFRMYLETPDRRAADTLIPAAATLLVSIWALAGFWFEFRNRQALLWTSYVLDSQGVLVKRSDSSVLVPWHEVDAVEYIRTFSAIRIRSKLLKTDAMIAVPKEQRARDGTIGSGPFIMHLVESQCGSRFKRRWFP